MATWIRRLRWLATGAVTLGILQGIEGLNFNQLFFQFLNTIIALFVSVFFGADPTTVV